MDGYTGLYEDLAVPLRTEYGLGPHQLLLDHAVEGFEASLGPRN
jgi:hypothetical protein